VNNTGSVDERPSTLYATTPDGISVTYQVAGSGLLDVVVITGFAYPIDLLWENADFLHFAQRLERFGRIIWPERRGVGASGGDVSDHFDEETAHGDLTAILRAADCGRVVLVGTGTRGTLAISYAATYPERVSALVLIDSFAHYVQEDDYPSGVPLAVMEQIADDTEKSWGQSALVSTVAPSAFDDDALRAWLARCQRLGLGPAEASMGFRKSALVDVREYLAGLSVPTLVLFHRDGSYIPASLGEYLAEHIPGAKAIELSGADNLFFVGDSDLLLDEVEEFLTGSRQGPTGDVRTSNVLFTDIVSSTERAAQLGHRAWTKLTDEHNSMVRGTLVRFRGREVKTTGDGFLAIFDSSTRSVMAAAEIVVQASAIGVEVRAGVHTGEVEIRQDDVLGLAVNVAKRICDLADPTHVLISESVRAAIVGSGIASASRGVHLLKGVPDEWHLFDVSM
jgi:class 3 adenylate cyclase